MTRLVIIGAFLALAITGTGIGSAEPAVNKVTGGGGEVVITRPRT